VMFFSMVARQFAQAAGPYCSSVSIISTVMARDPARRGG
jgi:hypothetical protein